MQRLWNNTKTAMLMGGLMGLCMGVGYLIGGRSAMVWALGIGAAMNFIAFFYSDKIALATMRAREICRDDDPVLWDTVARLAAAGGLPMPKVCISPAEAPNAFATGRGPRHSAVCVTVGLRRLLSDNELAGVIAHELSHVKNRDVLISTVAATVAGAITWLTYLAMFSGGRNRRGNALVALLLMILAPIAAALIQMAISRSREFEADRGGAEIAGSPRGLAGALAKLDAASRHIPLPVPDSQSNMFIVAPLTGSDVAKLFSTHPPVAERIDRLMAMER